MTNYHPGQRIRCRGEEWQVLRAAVHKIGNGGSVWEVEARGLTNIVAGQQYIFMNDLDEIEVVDPSDIEPQTDVSGKGIKARLFWEACLRRLLPRNGGLYLGQHGAFKPYEYQLKPASQALKMIRPRLLIADSVGLGKTIECGVLLAELIRRGKANRVLCAVPKATLEQFQNEMWARFSIPFHRLDSKGLERLRQDLPTTMNPFYHFDKSIISVDTLKLKKYQKMLEDCHFDVLVIDECHNVADRTNDAGGSARHKVARRLAERANNVILMSATPHDGTKQGFASLIKLLDRTRIGDDENYKTEDFRDHFIRRTRSQVASEISERSQRKQQIVRVPMTAAEEGVLEFIHSSSQSVKQLKQRSSRGEQELFQTTLIKSFLSSPAALAETVARKIKNLTSANSKNSSDGDSLAAFLGKLQEKLGNLNTFSRLTHLAAYLKSNPASDDDRVVIFTERLKTMELLQDHLVKLKLVDGIYDPGSEEVPAGRLVTTVDGGMSDIELNRSVKAFQSTKHKLHILIATNVASEGLNLHHNCHRLFHFDLPWSFITLEQRNGRIDRLGQKKTPEIFYLASESSTKNTDIRDDFWIIKKLQKRIDMASTDLDEEALAKFSDGASEEAVITEAFETKQISDLEQMMLGGVFESAELSQLNAPAPVRKKLPTLFEKSPADFIEFICREAGISAKKPAGTKVEIELTKSLKHEAEQWPREFQPHRDDKTLVLEADPERMQQHYEQKRNSDALLEQSFMNEIHPAIALLENAAFAFFPGKQVPTVTLKGDDTGTVYFLTQASLFNSRNDVVQQYWQLVQHKKGSAKLMPLFDMMSPDHITEIAAWLNASIKNMKQRGELSVTEARRIGSLTVKTIELMRELTAECRTARGSDLRPVLKTELERIKKWESSRQEFLNKAIQGEMDDRHKGVFALQSRARDELKSLQQDSSRYNKFITEFLTTSADADIRILGCFIVGE